VAGPGPGPPPFTKFPPEKYDFNNLYEGFFKEKMAQIRQILKKKKKFKSPNLYNNDVPKRSILGQNEVSKFSAMKT
jgi:hypothetical protein